MVSRSETARPLLTPGEVMQLPSGEEIVMVSGTPPIRAAKVRYYEDRRLAARVLPPPATGADEGPARPDDWSGLPPIQRPGAGSAVGHTGDLHDEDPATGGLRREPGIEPHEDIVPAAAPPVNEFDDGADEADADSSRSRTLARTMRRTARQAALDPNHGIDL